MIRTKKRMILCVTLLLCMLSFIWGNSLTNGTASGEMSGQLMQSINAFLRLDERGADVLHQLLRKMAHFTEFTCLGLLLTWLFGMTGEKRGIFSACRCCAQWQLPAWTRPFRSLFPIAAPAPLTSGSILAALRQVLE